MIVHSIAPYNPPVAIIGSSKIGKHEYNLLIKNLKYKKGDFLISTAINVFTNITSHAVFKVKDIQEVHFLCDWERNSQGNHCPKVYHLQNSAGHNFWTVEDRWCLCPDEVVNRLGLNDITLDN